jgi:hypothetical protein
MALNKYGGFADGFTQGFGLVNSVIDRQTKKEQLEQAQLNNERDFTAAEDERKRAAEYRASDLAIKSQNSLLDRELKQGQLANQTAQTDINKTKANTENLKQKQLTDPNSLASQAKQAEIDSKKATTKRAKFETERGQQDLDIYNAANNLSSIYTEMLASDGNPTSEQLERWEKIYQSNKFTQFNIGTVVAKQTEIGNQAIGQYLQDMQAGLNPEMSNDVKKAFTVALGLNNSKALGKEITSEWENAPQWMRNKGGLRVESQGLYNVRADQQGKLTGDLYVWVKNDKGDQYPYFPPLTASRNNKDNKPLDLTLSDALQGVAGTAHMISQVAPVIRPAVRQARIQAKFGDNKGDNGQEAFQNRVTNILNTNVRAIQNGENTYNLFGLTEGMAELPQGTQLDETQVREMKMKIEEQLLFGSKPEPDQNRVDRWLKETTEALKKLPYQAEAAKGAEKRRTLGELIPEDKWSPRLVSELQGYFDEDGQIEDLEGLTEVLRKERWISGSGSGNSTQNYGGVTKTKQPLGF